MGRAHKSRGVQRFLLWETVKKGAKCKTNKTQAASIMRQAIQLLKPCKVSTVQFVHFPTRHTYMHYKDWIDSKGIGPQLSSIQPPLGHRRVFAVFHWSKSFFFFFTIKRLEKGKLILGLHKLSIQLINISVPDLNGEESQESHLHRSIWDLRIKPLEKYFSLTLMPSPYVSPK